MGYGWGREPVFTSDSRYAIVSNDYYVNIVDVVTQSSTPVHLGANGFAVFSPAVSPDGQYAVQNTAMGIKLINIQQGTKTDISTVGSSHMGYGWGREPCFVSTSSTNNPPITPSVPSGPSSGNTGVSYQYSTSTTDPDGDNIKYGWDWNGDSNVDEWTNYYSSGTQVTTSHSWSSAGSYWVKVIAEDIHGAQSIWSSEKLVVISGGGNNPPNTPSTPSGPSSGDVGVSLQYISSTIDPDGDNVKYHLDTNNDGIIDHTSGFYSSGDTYSIQVTFNSQGTYYLRFKAEDIHGAQSSWSDSLTVTIGTGGNNPPNTPNKPTGSTTGDIGIQYTYSTSSTDPDNDNIKYGWDIDSDNIIDYWTGFYTSGQTCSVGITFSAAGTYHLRVKAKDSENSESAFSTALTIVISGGGNQPPNKPTITGPTQGKSGTRYAYEARTTDPNGDQLYYLFDWGDGTDSGWIGPYTSGISVSADNIWSNGNYQIKVKAKDTNNAESEWSDPLSISMPKHKTINKPFLIFLKNHPHMFPLIRQIFDL